MGKLTRDQLKALAQTRLDDAKVLIREKQFSGAYHLTGIAVECALKACISTQTQQFDFPDKVRVLDSWVHDLTKLVNTAGLQEELGKRSAAEPQFGANWSTVKDWSVESRYAQYSETQANDMFAAVTDKTHGIMGWIGKHW